VEERINDAITFSRFIKLGFEYTAPDHSTISRFRTALTELGLTAKLMRELNKQFKKYNIDRVSEGVIVDATIVDSPYHPHLSKNLVIARIHVLSFKSLTRWSTMPNSNTQSPASITRLGGFQEVRSLALALSITW